jgi:hypothetical protein
MCVIDIRVCNADIARRRSSVQSSERAACWFLCVARSQNIWARQAARNVSAAPHHHSLVVDQCHIVVDHYNCQTIVVGPMFVGRLRLVWRRAAVHTPIFDARPPTNTSRVELCVVLAPQHATRCYFESCLAYRIVAVLS